MTAHTASRTKPWSLHELTELPECVRGGHVVIGNFDGVHLGHGKIIQHAQKLASIDGRPVVAITFEPHPGALPSPRGNLCRVRT